MTTSTEPNIPETLRPHLVPIDSLKPWPGNPRVGNVDAMADSLKENGQYRLAVVQKSTGYICAGSHMWQAAKDVLGWPHIAAVHLDLTDAQAKRLLLADNRLADMGSYNDYLLTDMLRDLHEEDPLLLQGTGYNDDDFDALLRSTDALGNASTAFLDTFIAPPHPDDPFTPPTPQTPGGPVPNPFTNQPIAGPPPGAPPHGLGMPTQPTVTTTTTITGPPQPYQPPHTGPGTYQGPGAPSAPSAGVPLPPPIPTTTVSWVVTEPQRDTIRKALSHARDSNQLDNGSAALVAVCTDYLTLHGITLEQEEEAA